MKLIRPKEEYLPQYREAVHEDIKYRPHVAGIFSDPNKVIAYASNLEKGIDLPPGYVKATTFWLIDGEKFIGQIGIRHQLTPALLQFGGHIGYEVRWSESGKGYGTKMLQMALPFCRSDLGLDRVLITCDEDNLASRRVIEKNGGIFENQVINHLARGRVKTRRYWISL
ncbi:MAG: GNAT family N-acetyltransferase [Tissierellia bacterium]|nr:GNAT family N-acetyltransferase [Tissierellia bacterium]